MLILDLQLFGGRGGSSGGNGGGGSGGGSGGGENTISKLKEQLSGITNKQIDKMGRRELETLAKAAYIVNNVGNGMSAETATNRANALMDGNTTAQLKKYLKAHRK